MSVNIYEYDNSSAGRAEYRAFTVVVPGVQASGKDSTCFDENGICELKNQTEFTNKIGARAAVTITVTETVEGTTVTKKYKSNGNQIAYELLGLGYTVLYVNVGDGSTVAGDGVVVGPTVDAPDTYAALMDKAAYDFSYIISGITVDDTETDLSIRASLNSKINNIIANIATTRGDCTALIEVDKAVYAQQNQASAITAIKALVKTYSKNIDKYSGIFAPEVTYTAASMSQNSKFGSNLTFPAAFHYLACEAYTVGNLGYQPWYAAAGYDRGVSRYTVESTACTFGERATNELCPRTDASGDLKHAVNLVIKDHNNYYIWGNRTAHELSTDESTGGLVYSHFLNVRQLCTVLKKELYVAGRHFQFDPNSDTLWINFCNRIKPIFDKAQADQGIEEYDFRKIKDTKKATLSAEIQIKPIEAVEDFNIGLYLVDSIGGTQVTITEN